MSENNHDTEFVDDILDGVSVGWTREGGGKLYVEVCAQGEELASTTRDIDILRSDQKRGKFANRARDEIDDDSDIDSGELKRAIIQWFEEKAALTDEERRDQFMSPAVKEIIDGTNSVKVYASEQSEWRISLTLWEKEATIKFESEVMSGSRPTPKPLEDAIMNRWHEVVELSEEEWKSIRDEWVSMKRVVEVNESTSESIADRVIRSLSRTIIPRSDKDSLANEPACVWFDKTNAAGYERGGEPIDGPIVWVRAEHVEDTLKESGRDLDYKGQLVKTLIHRGDLNGDSVRRRWGPEGRTHYFPFNADSLEVDEADVGDGDGSATSEVPA